MMGALRKDFARLSNNEIESHSRIIFQNHLRNAVFPRVYVLEQLIQAAGMRNPQPVGRINPQPYVAPAIQRHCRGLAPMFYRSGFPFFIKERRMAEPHVVSALRDKRTELAGLVVQFEKQLGQHQVNLAHVDATMRLFDPDNDQFPLEAFIKNNIKYEEIGRPFLDLRQRFGC
jgi:hypothetical protein